MIVNLNAFLKKIQYFEILSGLHFFRKKKTWSIKTEGFCTFPLGHPVYRQKEAKRIKSKHAQAFNSSGSSSSAVTVKQLVLAMAK